MKELVKIKVIVDHKRFYRDEYGVYGVYLLEDNPEIITEDDGMFVVTGHGDELIVNKKYVLEIDSKLKKHRIYDDSYSYIEAEKIIELTEDDVELVKMISRADMYGESKVSVFRDFAATKGKSPSTIQNRWYRNLKAIYEEGNINDIHSEQNYITQKQEKLNYEVLNGFKEEILQTFNDKISETVNHLVSLNKSNKIGQDTMLAYFEKMERKFENTPNLLQNDKSNTLLIEAGVSEELNNKILENDNLKTKVIQLMEYNHQLKEELLEKDVEIRNLKNEKDKLSNKNVFSKMFQAKTV